MIRIAAVGDLHAGEDSAPVGLGRFDDLAGQADLLLLAGDLTKRGRPEEAAVVAESVRRAGVPVAAVLGNHDYECDRPEEVAAALRDAGAAVLEGTSATWEVGGAVVAVAGSKGFGGGFAGACATPFGEPETKAFINHTASLARGLEGALRSVEGADVRVALLHYSPVPGTLAGERREIYPFLGSYLLAEAVDRAGADLVVHGHAHAGTARGRTPGGVPVRNVAQPVLGGAYALLCLEVEPPVASAVARRGAAADLPGAPARHTGPPAVGRVGRPGV